jgi:hypothetical protein
MAVAPGVSQSELGDERLPSGLADLTSLAAAPRNRRQELERADRCLWRKGDRSRVRIGLAGGGSKIRTLGPRWGRHFSSPRSSVQGPSLPRERSSTPPKRRGRSGACYMGFARLQPGSEPLSLSSAREATPRQKGRRKQVSRKRAQKQANEALMAEAKDRSSCGAKLSNTVSAIGFVTATLSSTH